MGQFQTCVFFLLAIFGFFEGSFGDHQCTAVRGVCQLTTVACNNGTYTAGLCDGAVNRRCCVPYNDAACSSRGGNCRTDSLPCTGSYVSGLCGGPTNRRCCVPTPVVTAPPLPPVITGYPGCSGVTIVSRAQWGARAPTSTATMGTPVSLVFIHHTAGAACSSLSTCSAQARAAQNLHMDTNRWSDIGYNFLVGGDGMIYEGRGWDRVGAHTQGYNDRAVAISFMGTFTTVAPTATAMQAAQNLIACGIQRGKISSAYSLYGHRQARGAATECPGNRLYAIIQGWRNWRSGTAP